MVDLHILLDIRLNLPLQALVAKRSDVTSYRARQWCLVNIKSCDLSHIAALTTTVRATTISMICIQACRRHKP